VRKLLLIGLAALLATPASATVIIDWVAVGNAGNAADTPSSNCFAANCGSVSSNYYIDKYEVTNAQYAELLNAKAAADPLSLYNTSMGSDVTNGGITRSGVSGSFTYAAKVGFETKPVTYVSFYDSLRFSNWLNNGQGSGDTETGAYTLLGGTATPSNGLTVARNGGANIFLTSENEWYKAAYFNGTSYFDYPVGTDTQTVCAAPGATANRANCGAVVAVRSPTRAPTPAPRAPTGRSIRVGTCSNGTSRSEPWARSGASGAGTGPTSPPAASPRRPRTPAARRTRATSSVSVSRVWSPSPARDCS